MNFDLSHAVDDSDVAFVMRLDRKSTICSMMSSRSTHYHKVGTNIDGFINLATLNYLLAGLQLCYSRKHQESSKWFELLHDLDQERYAGPGTQLTLWDLRYITRELIVPFGVVRGSEKQGGQDETGISPATFPVNFVCNLVLDGHERNVLNYWHYHDVSDGDDLVFRLKPMPIPKGKNGYTLNHYYKRFVQQNFEAYFQVNQGEPRATHIWQLVPDVFTLDCKPENDQNFGEPGVRMSRGFDVPKDYVWQEHGFWHIARSQVMVRKYALTEYYNDDMANQMKTSHLDVTFEPTYTKVPGEVNDSMDPRCVKIDDREHRVPTREDWVRGRFADDIMPGMMAPAAPKAWSPQLLLEGAASFAGRETASFAGREAGPCAARHELDLALDPPRRDLPRHELDLALDPPRRNLPRHELDLALEPPDRSMPPPPPQRVTRPVQRPDRGAPRPSGPQQGGLDHSILFRDLPALPESPSVRTEPSSSQPGASGDFSSQPGAAEDFSLPFSSPLAAPKTAAGRGGKKRSKPHDEAAQ